MRPHPAGWATSKLRVNIQTPALRQFSANLRRVGKGERGIVSNRFQQVQQSILILLAGEEKELRPHCLRLIALGRAPWERLRRTAPGPPFTRCGNSRRVLFEPPPAAGVLPNPRNLTRLTAAFHRNSANCQNRVTWAGFMAE